MFREMNGMKKESENTYIFVSEFRGIQCQLGRKFGSTDEIKIPAEFREHPSLLDDDG
jgi:hypothetical protein